MATELFGIDLEDGLKVSELERRKMERWIKNGLRRFYYPPQPQGGYYNWRFLQAVFTFEVDPNTVDYRMPATFGGLIGDLVHIPGDNVRLSVIKVTPGKILEMR